MGTPPAGIVAPIGETASPMARKPLGSTKFIKELKAVLANFEIPVIENYIQLAWVLFAFAGLAFAGRGLWRSIPTAIPGSKRVVPAGPVQTPIRGPNLKPAALDLEKLGTVIAHTTDRVLTIAEKQQAAALKIDSTEMAINRLNSELAAIMSWPRPALSEGVPGHLGAPPALVAHPLMPLPERSALAA